MRTYSPLADSSIVLLQAHGRGALRDDGRIAPRGAEQRTIGEGRPERSRRHRRLLTGTNLANHKASAITTYASYVSQFGYSRVDGRFAPTPNDLRVLMGSPTYAHAASVYRTTTTDFSAVDRLMLVTGKHVRVSALVRPWRATNRTVSSSSARGAMPSARPGKACRSSMTK